MNRPYSRDKDYAVVERISRRERKELSFLRPARTSRVSRETSCPCKLSCRPAQGRPAGSPLQRERQGRNQNV